MPRCARWSARSAARTYDLAAPRPGVRSSRKVGRRGAPAPFRARVAARAAGPRGKVIGCAAAGRVPEVPASGVMPLGGDCAGAAQAGQALGRGSSEDLERTADRWPGAPGAGDRLAAVGPEFSQVS